MKPLEFFLERVEKRLTDENHHLGECWIWTATLDGNGRPYYWDSQEEKKNKNAAREIFKLIKEPGLPDGREHPICHKCIAQPTCINPDHLYHGTPKSNRQDAVEQNRIPLKKLKGKEQQIITLFKQGVEQKEIAKQVGVCRMTIMRFLNGQYNNTDVNYVEQANKEKEALIKKLYEEGKSVAQIVVLANTVDSVVYRVVPEIRDRPKGRATETCSLPLPERNKKIKEMREKGIPVREIAATFNISIPLVYTVLKQV